MANSELLPPRDAGDDALRDARALLARLADAAGSVETSGLAETQDCLRALLARAERVDAERANLQRQQAALRTVIASVPFFVFWKHREGVLQPIGACSCSGAEALTRHASLDPSDSRLTYERRQSTCGPGCDSGMAGLLWDGFEPLRQRSEKELRPVS